MSKQKRNLTLLLLIGALGMMAFPSHSSTSPDDPALLARGAYLARAADCNACHRGVAPGSADYSGGLAISTPMGNIIATNITPSEQYGIGRYSEEQFKRAVTEGIRADGTHLYPAMPYSAYQGISDADIHALYIWFQQSVPASDSPPPETSLSFPWSVRGLMAIWNPLNAELPESVASQKNPQTERGYYLTEVLGHCSACHSPRNIMMGEDMGQRFSGGDIGGWHAPNITADPVSGIGGWSDSDLSHYLKSGNLPGKGTAAGGMAEAVDHSLRYLSDSDISAMIAYLRQIPAIRNSDDLTPAWQHNQKPQTAGKIDHEAELLYQQACAACHRSDGEGAYNNTFPSLNANTTTGSTRSNNLVKVILDGVQREGAKSGGNMPAFGEVLSDQQVALLSNYVAHRFGNPSSQVSASDVATLRAGGEKPLIVRLLPVFYGIAAVVIILLVALFLRRSRRKGASQ
ncbi:MAG: c-type cytochrome [Limnobaculum xujianqingii]